MAKNLSASSSFRYFPRLPQFGEPEDEYKRTFARAIARVTRLFVVSSSCADTCIAAFFSEARLKAGLTAGALQLPVHQLSGNGGQKLWR